jgi:hypothetical protein
MRSQYKFTDLKKETVVTLYTPEEIFYRMYNLLLTGKLTLSTEDLSIISESIPDGKYWIAQKTFITKGKKSFFAGHLFCAYKEEIIKFIQLSIEEHDLRNLIMQPIFEYEYEFVVLIRDEGDFSIIEK